MFRQPCIKPNDKTVNKIIPTFTTHRMSFPMIMTKNNTV